MESKCSACGILTGEGHIYPPVAVDGALLCSACAADLKRWGYIYLGEGTALVSWEGHLKKARTSEKRLVDLAGRHLSPEQAAAALLKGGN